MDSAPQAVLAAYGNVMLIWQIVEQHLGELWMMNLLGEHQLMTKRNVEKGLKRFIHAASRATAAETLKGLETFLDGELFEDLQGAVKWRDLLAHRYLRERMRGDLENGRFQPGTSDELGELYDRFVSIAIELERLITDLEADVAEDISQMAPEEKELYEKIGRAIFRNEPLG